MGYRCSRVDNTSQSNTAFDVHPTCNGLLIYILDRLYLRSSPLSELYMHV